MLFSLLDLPTHFRYISEMTNTFQKCFWNVNMWTCCLWTICWTFLHLILDITLNWFFSDIVRSSSVKEAFLLKQQIFSFGKTLTTNDSSYYYYLHYFSIAYLLIKMTNHIHFYAYTWVVNLFACCSVSVFHRAFRYNVQVFSHRSRLKEIRVNRQREACPSVATA